MREPLSTIQHNGKMSALKALGARIRANVRLFIDDNRGSMSPLIPISTTLIIVLVIFLEYNHGITIYNSVQKGIEQAVSAAVLLSIDDDYRKDEILYISDIPAALATCYECMKEDMALDDQFRSVAPSGEIMYYLTDTSIVVDMTPPYLVCITKLHIPILMCPDFVDDDAEFVIEIRAASHAQSLLNPGT